jgi:tripartite-type tricarboxylate transporter receptor subunit TctC
MFKMRRPWLTSNPSKSEHMKKVRQQTDQLLKRQEVQKQMREQEVAPLARSPAALDR